MTTLCNILNRDDSAFLFPESLYINFNKVFGSMNSSSDFASLTYDSFSLSEKELTKMCCEISESSLEEEWNSPENDIWNQY